MVSRPTRQRGLEEILQSTAGVLFPGAEQTRIALDSHDCDGETPLHVLLWRGDASGAKALIEAGANVNAVGDMGQTPLHVAVGKSMQDVVEALLMAGADPDRRSEFGQTPREIAQEQGGDMRRLLIQSRPARGAGR